MAVRRWLGDTLLNAGLVTRQQLDEALAIQNSTGQKLGQALVSLGYLSDNALLQTLCADAGIPYLNESELKPEADAVGLDLLGLVVRTNRINVRIDAVPGQGNLLGNLLCAITGILDPQATSARDLASALNAILALVPRTG